MAFFSFTLADIKEKAFTRQTLQYTVIRLWRIAKWILIAAVIITVTKVLYQSIHKLNSNHLNPGMVALYSTAPNTWIFRGNTPTKNTAFDYSLLRSTLVAKAKKAGHPLPKQFSIVDISLLRNTLPIYEAIQTHAEKNFFAQHPSKGVVINIPLNLDSTHTNTHYNFKSVSRAVKIIHKTTLAASPTHPVVIYVHCEDGINRTGTVLATYSIWYHHISVKNAIHKVNQVATVKNNTINTIAQLSKVPS